MAQYIFEGKYQNQSTSVKVKLLLIHFEDEKKVHFIYSPHLDLTGYGINFGEAKKSFEIVFEDFVDYTLKKETLGKVLSGLGWELKGPAKKPKRVIAPSITSVIKNNKYVSEIFDKYPVSTYHQEVGLPAFI
ncbi:MAG: hypothetical protein D4R64_15495 [Porphyromonadaceae bacterium]|nr:MAG: hypothetical protein D4R64_15495 [Porphyromonadaceae bacterium]